MDRTTRCSAVYGTTATTYLAARTAGPTPTADDGCLAWTINSSMDAASSCSSPWHAVDGTTTTMEGTPGTHAASSGRATTTTTPVATAATANGYPATPAVANGTANPTAEGTAATTAAATMATTTRPGCSQ